MKKVFLSLISLALLVSTYSSVMAQDPSINALQVAPDPILQYETGTITVNFSVGGSGAIPAGNIILQVSTPNSYLPDPADGPLITGTAAGLFTWVYDAPNRTLNGTNNVILNPGDGGLVDIQVRGFVITAPSFDNTIANLLFPFGAPNGNSIGNDNLVAGGRVAANPAPVKLVTFTANKEAQTAVLNWSTAEEVNSERFEVEHSLNGKQWRTIGTVAAKGNSQSTLWYSFVDADPANGENLYRLRMVDKDRTHAYSPVRSLSFDIKVGTYLYPNPVAEKLLINIDDWNKVERVQVYSNSGKAVYEAQSAPVDGIDVKNLPAGLYVVRVTRTNGAVEAYKVVKN